jgi:hypothetical protein
MTVGPQYLGTAVVASHPAEAPGYEIAGIGTGAPLARRRQVSACPDYFVACDDSAAAFLQT